MRTTFFTAANRKYEPFVLPYVASALIHNDDARVELCLEQPRQFEIENTAAIDILRRHFGDRFLFRLGTFRNMRPNSVRFVETPSRMTEFTYIGDIDILILEHVTPIHLKAMERTGLPYSNIQRPGQPRLSGLHFTRSDAYYPVQLSNALASKELSDEMLLLDLVESRGLPLPDPAETFRPQHGFHLSIQRQPKPNGLSWGLHKNRLEAYQLLRGTESWQALVPLFDHRYRVLLMALDTALGCLYPEAGVEPMPSYSIKALFLQS